MTQTIYFIFVLLHNDLVFLIICFDQQYQRPFEDQQIYQTKNYLHQGLSSLTQLDWKVHRELNSVVDNRNRFNIL